MVEVSRPHSDIHTHCRTRLNDWPEAATYTTSARDEYLCHQWDSNPRSEKSSDCTHRPHGHRDQHLIIQVFFFFPGTRWPDALSSLLRKMHVGEV